MYQAEPESEFLETLTERCLIDAANENTALRVRLEKLERDLLRRSGQQAITWLIAAALLVAIGVKRRASRIGNGVPRNQRRAAFHQRSIRIVEGVDPFAPDINRPDDAAFGLLGHDRFRTR